MLKWKAKRWYFTYEVEDEIDVQTNSDSATDEYKDF